MNIAQCVYLHFRCWTFGVFPLFGYCEEHISTVSGPSPWPGPAAVREPAVHMGVPPSRGKTMGRRVPAQQPLHEVAAVGSVPVAPPALFLVGTGGEGARASKNGGAHTSPFLWDDPTVVAKAGWEGHTYYMFLHRRAEA